MSGTLVRKLSDGEELVVEALTPSGSEDPRERAIEARKLALADGEEPADRDPSV